MLQLAACHACSAMLGTYTDPDPDVVRFRVYSLSIAWLLSSSMLHTCKHLCGAPAIAVWLRRSTSTLKYSAATGYALYFGPVHFQKPPLCSQYKSFHITAHGALTVPVLSITPMSFSNCLCCLFWQLEELRHPLGVVRSPLQPEEVRGLSRSGDLSRMLPSEMALLAHGWPRKASRSLTSTMTSSVTSSLTSSSSSSSGEEGEEYYLPGALHGSCCLFVGDLFSMLSLIYFNVCLYAQYG